MIRAVLTALCNETNLSQACLLHGRHGLGHAFVANRTIALELHLRLGVTRGLFAGDLQRPERWPLRDHAADIRWGCGFRRLDRNGGDALRAVDWPEDALEVELYEERNPAIAEAQVAEVTLHLKGVTLRARDASREMLHSINMCADEMAVQVKRHRDKRRKRRESRAAATTPPGWTGGVSPAA